MINVETTKEQLIVELEALRWRVAELEKLEAERKQVEEALRESNRRFRDIAEHTLEWIWEVDANGGYTYVSPVVEKILGYEPEEVLKKHFYDLFHPDEREELKKAAFEVFAKKQPFREFVNRNMHKNGKIVWLSTSGVPILDEEGNFLGYRGADIDITERRQVEEALELQQAYFQQLFDNSPEGIALLDDTDRVVQVNKGFEELFGYRAEEVKGRFLYYMVVPEDRIEEASALARAALNNQVSRIETVRKRKDGSLVDISLLHYPIQFGNKTVAVYAIYSDITERKRAAEALRESEENLRTYLESAPDGVYLNDLKGTFLYGNKKAEEITGYKREELIGKSFLKLNLLPAKYLAKAGKLLALNTMGKPTGPDELELIRKDGSRVWVEITTTPIRQQGKVVVIGFVRDITERKRAEQEMRVKDSAIASSINAIAIADLEGNLTYVNHAFLRMWGYDDEKEILGKNAVEFWRVAEEAVEVMQVAMDRGGLIGELAAKRKDGSIFDVQLSASVVRNEAGKPICRLGSFIDITERKRVEEQIIQAAKEWRTTFDSITDFVSIHDKDFRLIKVNKSFANAFKMRPKELIGKSCYELVHGTTEPCSHCPGKETLRTGKPHTGEFFEPHLGVYVEVSTSPVFNEDGGLVGFVHLTKDITKRKRMEEALRESERKYKLLFESTLDGMCVLDAETMKIVLANQAAAKIYGFDSAEDAVGTKPLDFVPPEDRERVIRIIAEDMFAKDLRRVNEFRTITKDGREIWISALGTRTEYQGRLAGLVSIRDITERRQAEEALELQQAYFQQLFDNSPDAIAMWDDTERVVQVNRGFETLFGYRAEEVKGKFINDVVVPEDRIEEASALARSVLNGEVCRKETVRKRKDGSLVDVSFVHYPIQLGGKTIGVYTIWTDITERKEMEQQLILTDRLASVGELVSGIAHELNNPLTGVIGFSQLLLDKDVSDDVKLDLRIIYSEAQRAADVVKGLLTFARKHVPVKQPVNIDSIIEKVLTLRAYEQRVNNIQVNTYFAPDLPEVMADHFQLQQVFLNIIINAEYFMIEAHGEGTLTITTEKVGDIIKTSFTDDGPGINQENLGHLFDPFFTTKEVGKGTGLGLSICHGIITEHGGQIYAESKLGKGTTFVVELPISDHW